MHHWKVVVARYKSVEAYIQHNQNVIKDYDFQWGDLVLVRNSQIKTEHNRKAKPQYNGPMVVVRRTEGGSYILVELDGSVLCHCYAAFRVVPYHSRPRVTVRSKAFNEWEEYLPDKNEGLEERFTINDKSGEELGGEEGSA